MRGALLLFLLTILVPLGAQPAPLLAEALSAASGRQATIARKLRDYPSAAFGPAERRDLTRLLSREDLGGRKDYVLLAGFLGEVGAVEAVAASAPASPVKQAVNLARVRGGDAAKRAARRGRDTGICNYPQIMAFGFS